MHEDDYKDTARECFWKFRHYFEIVKELKDKESLYAIINSTNYVKLTKFAGSVIWGIEINPEKIKFVKPFKYEDVLISEDIYFKIEERFNPTFHSQGSSSFSAITFDEDAFYEQVSLLSDDEELINKHVYSLFDDTEAEQLEQYVDELIMLVFEYRSIEYRHNFIKKSLDDECCIKSLTKNKNKGFDKYKNNLMNKAESMKKLLRRHDALTMEGKELDKILDKVLEKPDSYILKINKNNIQQPSTINVRKFLTKCKASQKNIKIFIEGLEKKDNKKATNENEIEQDNIMSNLFTADEIKDIAEAALEKQQNEPNGGFPSFIEYIPPKK